MAFTIADFLVSLGFNVDEASRAKAERSYAQYEKAVKDAEARVEKARAAGAKASVQLGAQKELAQAREALAAAKAAADVETAEKRKAKAVTDSGRQIERAERDRAKAIGDATAFSVLKLEAFVGALEAMARGAVTAVTSVVQSFDNLYYASGRTGTSVRDLRGIGYAFSQVGGSAQQGLQAVESFTAALRNNPGLQGFVKNLGVGDNLGGVDKLLATVEELNKQPYYIGVQQAGMLGISEETYNLLTRQIDGVKRYRAEYKATAQQIGLNEEEAAKTSKQLSQALGSLSVIAEVSFAKILTDQLPRISGWFETFTRWIQTHQPEIASFIQAIADGLEKFGGKAEEAFKTFMQSLEDGSLKKGLQDFSDRIGRLAEGLERVVKAAESFLGLTDKFGDLGFGPAVSRILGLGGGQGGGVPGVGAVGGYNPLEGGGGAGRKPDDRTWWERNAPTVWGGKPDPNAPAGGGGLRARAARALRGDQSGGVAANPGAYKDVLDHIARAEGTATQPGGGYNTSLSYGRYLPGGKEQNLTGKTLDEILALGDFMRRQPGNPNSSAMGRYQIVGSTLRDQMRKLGLKGSDLFDEKTQDRIAANLARQRGADPVGLQQEWASLVGAKNATAVALMQKVDPKASTMPTTPPVAAAPPKVDVTMKAPMPSQGGRPIKLPDYLNGPGGFDVNALTSPAAPLGANSAPVNNTDASRTVTINAPQTNNVTVSGSNDPQTHGRVMEGALGRVHQTLLENTQSAVRG